MINHALGVRCAHIVEQMVLAADDAGKLVHDFLHNFRTGGIEGIYRFARLEENIGVLRRAAKNGMIRR